MVLSFPRVQRPFYFRLNSCIFVFLTVLSTAFITGCKGPKNACSASEHCPKSKSVCLEDKCVKACPGFADGETCCNGIVEEGEECDAGEANSDDVADACRSDCRVA